MRVGILTQEMPPNAFGIGSFVKGLTDALSELGVNFKIIGPDGDVVTGIMNVKSPLMKLVQFTVFVYSAMKKVEDEFDLFHYNYGALPIRSRKPMITTMHVDARQTRNVAMNLGIAEKFEKELLKKQIKNSETVVFVSRKSFEVSRDLVDDPEKIRIIPPGINVGEFERMGVEEREDFVLCVGRFSPEKNQEALLKAIKGTGYRIHFTGSRRGIEALALTYGVRNQVSALGFISREDLLKEFSKARVFVLPSKYETFGISALEAMASGTPVIVSSGTGICDFLKDGKDALVVDPEPARIKDAIDTLMDDDRLWRKLSKNGQKKAEEFDWRIIAEKYKKIYEEQAP